MTLPELMVSVAIAGVLSAIAIPSHQTPTKKADLAQGKILIGAMMRSQAENRFIGGYTLEQTTLGGWTGQSIPAEGVVRFNAISEKTNQIFIAGMTDPSQVVCVVEELVWLSVEAITAQECPD